MCSSLHAIHRTNVHLVSLYTLSLLNSRLSIRYVSGLRCTSTHSLGEHTENASGARSNNETMQCSTRLRPGSSRRLPERERKISTHIQRKGADMKRRPEAWLRADAGFCFCRGFSPLFHPRNITNRGSAHTQPSLSPSLSLSRVPQTTARLFTLTRELQILTT